MLNPFTVLQPLYLTHHLTDTLDFIRLLFSLAPSVPEPLIFNKASEKALGFLLWFDSK